jgi:hypothetical protein
VACASSATPVALIHRYAALPKGHESLRRQADLSLFDGRMQIVANRGARVEITNLAMWLIERAGKAGPVAAVSDLQRYLDAPDVPFRNIFGLSGLKVDRSYELSPRITVIPWHVLPNSYGKEHICQEYINSFDQPSSALIQQVSLPKAHLLPEEERKLESVDVTEVQDTILCIGAVAPCAAEIMVSWLEPPEWAPVMGVGFTLPHAEGGHRTDTWTDGHAQTAARLLSLFRELDDGPKDILRLASQRLRTAMRRMSRVDSAIDLGISMETLFLGDLPDDRGELTFRLRLRASRYMEEEYEKREEVFRLVSDLYTLRSKAVHTGRIPQKVRHKNSSDILEEGYGLVATAIRRFVEEGMPDWSEVQLGPRREREQEREPDA